MAQVVYGGAITIKDYYNPVTESASIGLYNRTYDLAADVDDEDTYITVTAAQAAFVTSGDVALLSDDVSGPELVIITSVDEANGRLYCTITGAYTTADNAKVTLGSQFRWIKNDIDTLTGWASGMLLDKGGVSSITKSANILEGGNVADPSTAGLAVKNTSQFWKTLQTLGVSLVGCDAVIYRFDDAAKTLVLRGTVSRVSWDVAKYNISIAQASAGESADMYKTVSVNTFDVSESAPTIGAKTSAVFGEWRDNLVTLGGTAYRAENAIQFNADGGLTTGFSDDDGNEYYAVWAVAPNKIIDLFPIDGIADAASGYIFSMYIGPGSGVTWLKNLAIVPYTDVVIDDYLIGKYLVFAAGTGSSAGSYIISAASLTAANVLQLTLQEYTSEAISGQIVLPDSHVRIMKLSRQYNADTWPCEGFLDKTTGDVVDDYFLSYVGGKSKQANVTVSTTTGNGIVDIQEGSDSLSHIPEFTIVTDTTTHPNRNAAYVLGKNYTRDNPDAVNAYTIALVDDIEPLKNSTIESFRNTEYETTVYKSTTMDGWYSSPTVTSPPMSSYVDSSYGSLNYTKQKYVYDPYEVYNLFYEMRRSWSDGYLIGGYSYHFTSSLVVSLPQIPSGVNIKAAYLNIDASAFRTTTFPVAPNRTGIFLSKVNPWISSSGTTILDENDIISVYGDVDTTNVTSRFSSLYYEPSLDGTKSFNQENNFSGDTIALTTGKAKFNLNTSNNKDYNKLQYCVVALSQMFTLDSSLDPITGSIAHRYYHISVVFEHDTSIGSKIFAPFSGRVFAGTWGGRKTATSPIVSAPDILEHAARLQKTSGLGVEPSDGWGHAYNDAVMVDTTAFDNVTLDPVRLNYAGVFDGDKATTENIKRTICRNAMLLNYAKSTGEESVSYLVKSQTTPSDAITFSSIIQGSTVTVSEPDPQKIYAQPTIRYLKDLNTGNYRGTIYAQNVDDMSTTISDATKEARVVGLNGSDAVEFWDRCHALYVKAGAIYKAPDYMTDLDFANGMDEKAQAVARRYALDWVSWMGNKTIRFTVPAGLDAGSGTPVYQWDVGRRITVQFPHETDDAVVECVVFRIAVSCEAPYDADIEAVMLEEYEASYEAQEVLNTVDADREIQETLDETDDQIQEVL